MDTQQTVKKAMVGRYQDATVDDVVAMGENEFEEYLTYASKLLLDRADDGESSLKYQ